MKNIKEIDFDQVSSSLEHAVELTGLQQAGSIPECSRTRRTRSCGFRAGLSCPICHQRLRWLFWNHFGALSALYETLYSLHTLDEVVVERWFQLCNDGFRGYLCNTSLCFFSRVWLKIDTQDPNIYSWRYPDKTLIQFEKRREELKSQCAKLGICCEKFFNNPSKDSFRVFSESISEKSLQKKIRKKVKRAGRRVVVEKQKFIEWIQKSQRASEEREQMHKESIRKLLKKLERKNILRRKWNFEM
ncbi:hypothetical protein TNIN_147941 [Trichonephila inaurata madagascariensis]|uniref:Uncharacterized protein n=1 Tax=Trichonephila inaurata madagascariensis TaxID=2747483 RepID=A0A8X6XNJ6_9ARAC|nr:hypothetical protein TNIN_147941 [Trichonephila inaurata madagascariensis]